jgi:two-component system sensor histidine kinase CpxA
VRNLYLKIFVWFWATTVLMVAAVAWSTLQFVHVRQVEREPANDGVARAGAVVARIAAEVPRLQREQIGALLDEAERLTGTKAYVIDAIGDDVRGGRLPPDLEAYLRDPLGAEFGGGPTLSRGAIVMRPFLSPAGEPLRLLANLSTVTSPEQPAFTAGQSPLASLLRPTPARFATELRWLRVAVAVLVSGAVCYLLARYLTRPVRTLSEATKRLSAGDLGVRIGDAMGSRRDEIADLGGDFDAMAERIEGLVESQHRLLRDVSHELRSPLARLQVALGLARNRSQGRAGAELDRIEREAEHLDDLIGQILAFARLDEDVRRATLTRSRTVELGALLEEIASDAEFESLADVKGVTITRLTEATVMGERDQLRAALENVVRNAVRFTPAGTQVAIAVEPGPDAGSVRIAVRDQGPGVAETHLPHLFEPFYRVDESRQRGSGGHGLGLAIAERCITLHGGLVHASNLDGGGLEVEIVLPALHGR